MKKLTTGMAALAMATAVLVSGCQTTPAPDFGGKWRPINHFDENTREIPLNPVYTYYALPMDGTLKGLLGRWAKDTHAGLSYQLASDYTLPVAAGRIRTTDAAEALRELGQAYAAQQIALTIDNGALTARPASN